MRGSVRKKRRVETPVQEGRVYSNNTGPMRYKVLLYSLKRPAATWAGKDTIGCFDIPVLLHDCEHANRVHAEDGTATLAMMPADVEFVPPHVVHLVLRGNDTFIGMALQEKLATA